MARKPYEILGGDTPFIWDNTTALAPGCAATIVATEEEIRAVGNYLYSMIAVRWPDENNVEDTGRPINNLDEGLRNSIHRIARQLQIATIICLEVDDMRLRQKPDNSCVLQQFQDGVWVDVFDYSLCMGESVQATQNTTNRQQLRDAPILANSLMEQFNDLYTGTSASFDPKLTMDHVEGVNRRAALCEALYEMAKSFNEASRKLKEDESEGISRAAVVLGAGVAILALLGTLATFGVFGVAIGVFAIDFMALGSTAIAGGVLGVTTSGLALWSESIRATAKEVFEDTAALKEWTCLWFANFDGMDDISFEAFSTAVDYEFATNENTGYLEVTFSYLRSQQLAYAAFLRTWKKNIELSENGVVMQCEPCAAPDVVLEASPGWPPSMVQYEGINGDSQDTYLITTGYTGNYATGSIRSVGDVPFWIVSVTPVNGDWPTAGNLLPQGYGYKTFNDINTSLLWIGPTAQIGLYFGVGQFRITVSNVENP
jgi:hypothetical protein